MIACNACQLLATDLQFCHGLWWKRFVGALMCVLIRFCSILARSSFKLVSRVSSRVKLTCLVISPRGRSPRNLRGIRALTWFVFVWCFNGFVRWFWADVWFNLHCLGAFMGYLKVILELCWVMLRHHAAMLNLLCWVVDLILCFVVFFESDSRGLTWDSG